MERQKENKKKTKEAARWKARDRKKAAQERLHEKTMYMNNQAMDNKAKNQCETKKRLKMTKSDTSLSG